MYASGAQGLLTLLHDFLADKAVSEILINKPQEVWIEKNGVMEVMKIPELTEAYLLYLFQLLANENQQLLSAEQPFLSGQLPDGSRVQLVMPPTAKFPALSIRRKVTQEMTLENYHQKKFYRKMTAQEQEEESQLSDDEKYLQRLFFSKQWNEFIVQAVKFKKNIVISGGTSSGKTTFLNACLRAIDHHERIIILEDTREIDIPHPNQVQLAATKGEQGIAKVSMQDLVQCCLRLRPDRIIMGEIRGKEIVDFISACSTGHEGSMTSIHANNPHAAFMRMMQLYKLNNVPSMTNDNILHELRSVIDIIIQLTKTAEGRVAESIYYKYGKREHEYSITQL